MMISRIALTLALLAVAAGAVMAKEGPFLWEADTTFMFPRKAQVTSYLDDLQRHKIDLIWVQVELYGKGEVVYRKTTLTGLPTMPRYLEGDWQHDEYLDYLAAEAHKRGMKVVIKFHGSNHPLWDAHTDWRKRNWKGDEVLWGGTLKNFCVNAPYWDQVFLKMVEEVARNYPSLDGFYLDTAQVLPEGSDGCYCPFCRGRFKKETGRELPLKPITAQYMSDPLVALHVRKRVEWVNRFYEKFAGVVRSVRPDAPIITNLSGGYNSFSDGLSIRHAAKYVTHATPEPVNTPRRYSMAMASKRKKAGQPVDVNAIAREIQYPGMDTYGYNAYMVKQLIGDSSGKPVIPISRGWFTDLSNPMSTEEIEIGTIESGLAGGAKGFCFFGYMGGAFVRNTLNESLWEKPEYIRYLRSIKTGTRAEWIAGGRPAAEIAILCDRDESFWRGSYWTDLQQVASIYGLLQHRAKAPVDLLSTSEPDTRGFGKTGYRLTPEMLSRHRVVLAPRLECVDARDLRLLRDYAKAGGKVVICGSIGLYDKFHQQIGPALLKGAFGAKWEPAAPAQVTKEAVGKGEIIRYPDAAVKSWSETQQAEFTKAILSLAGEPPVRLEGAPETTVLGFFDVPGQNLRYAHLFTLDPIKELQVSIRVPKGMRIAGATAIRSNGAEEKLSAVERNGYAVVTVRDLKPYYVMVGVRLTPDSSQEPNAP